MGPDANSRIVAPSTVTPTVAVEAPRPKLLARLRAFLGRRPILLLLLLTPGIPEYLSGSSSLNGIVVAPLTFVIFLGLNLGLYGPGVLLIREARVRWKKGWGSVLLLGAAYGILEEGIALSTLFNPASPVVGGLGYYGHFLGVNWVWAIGVLLVHVLYSISLPILLLDLALPATREKSFLGARGVGLVVTVLAADITVLMAIVRFGLGFWMGLPLFVGGFGAIAGLVALAYYLPASLDSPPTPGPTRRWYSYAALGASMFYGVLLLESIDAAIALPAGLAIPELLAFLGLVGYGFYRTIGRAGNERALVAFAAGALVDVMIFGLINGLPFPVAALADLAAIAFLLHLLRRYPTPRAGSVPRGSGGPRATGL